jgi:hypothetical protein
METFVDDKECEVDEEAVPSTSASRSWEENLAIGMKGVAAVGVGVKSIAEFLEMRASHGSLPQQLWRLTSARVAVGVGLLSFPYAMYQLRSLPPGEPGTAAQRRLYAAAVPLELIEGGLLIASLKNHRWLVPALVTGVAAHGLKAASYATGGEWKNAILFGSLSIGAASAVASERLSMSTAASAQELLRLSKKGTKAALMVAAVTAASSIPAGKPPPRSPEGTNARPLMTSGAGSLNRTVQRQQLRRNQGVVRNRSRPDSSAEDHSDTSE